MPAASFQHSVSIAAPIDMVWDTLMRADTWENIGPVDRVWDPVHDGDGILTGYRWSTQVGGKRFEGIAKSVFHDVPHRYVIDLDTGEVAGRIEIAMTGGNPATELTVTLDLRTKGVLSSMFFPLIRDAIGSGFPQQIESFARSIAH